MKLQGMFVAAATPFDHTGAIYRAKVQHNFDKWSRTAVAGFLVGGTSGEGPFLDAAEKVELVTLARPLVPEGRLILADVSGEGADNAAKLAKAVAEAGADAVVSSAPRLYPGTALLYFRTLADRSPVPLVLICDGLATEEIGAISAHPNIAGVIGSGRRIVEVRAAIRKDCVALCSSEQYVWSSLKAGAAGAVLAIASAAPYSTIAIWEAFRTREEDAGLDWQGRIAYPGELVTQGSGPAGLKHAMDLMGYYGGPPRLPLTVVSPAARQRIEDAFRDLRG
jgi:4-hydroxy-2-oxoglutarate aldolase